MMKNEINENNFIKIVNSLIASLKDIDTDFYPGFEKLYSEYDENKTILKKCENGQTPEVYRYNTMFKAGSYNDFLKKQTKIIIHLQIQWLVDDDYLTLSLGTQITDFESCFDNNKIKSIQNKLLKFVNRYNDIYESKNVFATIRNNNLTCKADFIYFNHVSKDKFISNAIEVIIGSTHRLMDEMTCMFYPDDVRSKSTIEILNYV